MAFAHFREPIQCPECGFHTHELYHSCANAENGTVLMCEACNKHDYDEWVSSDLKVKD
jgi:hypothetical protein